MAFDFEAGLSSLAAEVARLEADVKADAQGFWEGYGARRILNTIEKLSALAQRLHRHNREQAYKLEQ